MYQRHYPVPDISVLRHVLGMAYSGIPSATSQGIMSVSDNKYVIFLLMNLVLLVIGTFMDITPAISLALPKLLGRV